MDDKLEDWQFTDNGFYSRYGMDSSHAPIVELAKRILIDQSGSVLDLGCGNGILVQKICEERSDLVPFGIDCTAEKIEHAIALGTGPAENFFVGNLFDMLSRYRCKKKAASFRYELKGDRSAIPSPIRVLQDACEAKECPRA